MRDHNRINEICDLLREVWKQYPNKRLGELIADSIHTPICCYVSDEVLEEHLKQSLAWAKVLNKNKNRKERLTECGQERDSMREALTMTETKGCEYIVHFTEYSIKYPTEATVYKVVKQGVVTFTEEVEYYCYDPNKEKQLRTDEEHYKVIKEIIGDCENVKIKIPARAASLAASLIACFQRHGYEVEIYKDKE